MDFKLIDAIRIGYSIGNEKCSTDQFCIGKSLEDIRTRKINPFFHFLRFYLIIRKGNLFLESFMFQLIIKFL